MLFTREFSHVRVIVPSKDENVTDGFCSVVAHDIAEEIVWCASRPAHVNIAQLCKTTGLQEMCTGLISFFPVVMPVNQATPTLAHRSS